MTRKKVWSYLKRNWKVSSVIVGASLASWSWVLFVKVTNMSSSAALGYIIAVIAILLNTFLCSVVFITTIWYLQKTKKPSFWYVLKVGAVWAFAEFFAAWLTAFIWVGKDARLDTIFPFASLSYFAINTPLVYAGRLVGFFGLSALVAMLGFTLFSKKYRKYFLYIAVPSVLLCIGTWYFYSKPNGKTVKIIVASEHLGAPKPVNAASADLVVLPEYGLDDVNSSNLDQRIQSPSNREVFFVGSNQQSVNGKANNLLTFGSTKTGITYQQAKTRLVPGGEYLPYGVDLVLHAVHANEPLINFEVTRAVVKGTKPIHPLYAGNSVILGSAVCSSIISTQDYQVLTREGATVLTNSASLEIFNGSPIFTWQHTSLARFMATANARPFIQSSNDGKSFIIDQNGRVLASRWPVGTLEKQLNTNSQKTPYSVLGEWVVYVGAVIVLFDIIRHFKKPKLKAK